MYSLYYLSVQWNNISEFQQQALNRRSKKTLRLTATCCYVSYRSREAAWFWVRVLSFFFSFALTLRRYFGRLLEWRLKLFQMDRWWATLKKKSLFYGIKAESGLLRAEIDIRGGKGKERKRKLFMRNISGDSGVLHNQSPLYVFLYSGWTGWRHGMRWTAFPKKPFALLISYLSISSPPTKTHRNTQTWRPHSHVLRRDMGDVFHVFYAVYTHIIFERGTNLVAVYCRWWSICWAH